MRDVVIIGGGPAGASCALWLHKLGHVPLLIESGRAFGGNQVGSPFCNDWIATTPPANGDDIAAIIHQNILRAGIGHRLGIAVNSITKHGDCFALELAGDETATARFVVLATGTQIETGGLGARPGIVFGPGRDVAAIDAKGQRIAVLGGGDNAFENYLYLRQKAPRQLKLFARSVRARNAFRRQVPIDDLHIGPYEVDTATMTVNNEPFDCLVVLYGFTARLPGTIAPAPTMDRNGYVATNADGETSVPGLFAIGELANRMHPSTVTAMADGVTAAKTIQLRLEVGHEVIHA